MKQKKTASFTAVALSCVLALGMLAGCVPQSNGVTEEQQANRTYMATVNQTMDDLKTRLESFNDAVSRGDAVTMRLQADNAFTVIDNLKDIDTPQDMNELQQDYVEGCDTLKNALNAYVDLYTEISSATEEQPFDYSTYESRLKAIQDMYDQGIQKLQKADELALSLNGTPVDEGQEKATDDNGAASDSGNAASSDSSDNAADSTSASSDQNADQGSDASGSQADAPASSADNATANNTDTNAK